MHKDPYLEINDAEQVSISYTEPETGRPMIVSLEGIVSGALYRELTVKDGETFYPFGEEVGISTTNPSTVESVELTLKITGKHLKYWIGVPKSD